MLRQFLNSLISIFLMLALTLLQLSAGDSLASNSNLRTPPTFIVVVDISGSMNDRFPAPVQPVLTDSTKLMDVKRRLAMLTDHLPENTRVIVVVFDHEAKQLCDLTLDRPDARSSLRAAFSQIKSRDSSTNLWATLDTQLTLAKSLVDANPEGRVRVLLYSDGEDSNRNNPLNHEILVQKFGVSLQTAVRLDWISIGYDLQADVKNLLEKNGVQFTKPDTPDDFYPLIAGFKPSKVELLVGETLRIEDESTGYEITKRGVDWGDKTTSAVASTAEHRYSQPGTYKLRYRVQTRSGRKNEASTTISVHPRPAAETLIRVSAASLLVEEKLRVQDESVETATTFEWNTSDGQRSTSRSAEFVFHKPGTYQIRLERVDKSGQKSEATKSVKVILPPKPTASFRLGGKLQNPGDSVVLINESGDSAVQYQWLLNGKPWSKEKHPSIMVDTYGSYAIELTVFDRWNQSNVAKLEVVVQRPEAPIAEFEIPSFVMPDEKVLLVQKSTSPANNYSNWLLDGREIGFGPTVECQPTTPGEHEVTLIVSGQGGESRKSKKLEVRRFPPPVAAFSLGTERIFVDDRVRVNDASKGRFDQVRFLVDGDCDPLNFEFSRQTESRSFELSFSRVGKVTIHQTVIGPGGESSSEQIVTIATRAVQPLASFEMSKQTISSNLSKVRFLSKSKGTIERLEFDPGDGSPSRMYDPAIPIEHDYKPGQFIARIKAIPPLDSQLRSSTWSSNEIRIAYPLPTWVKNLLWQVAVLFMALVVVSLTWSKISKNRRAARQKRISGHLSIFDSREPFSPRSVEFAGTQSAETVDLDATTRVTVRSVDDGIVAYKLDVEREGVPVQSFELGDLQDVEVDSYRLTYTA